MEVERGHGELCGLPIPLLEPPNGGEVAGRGERLRTGRSENRVGRSAVDPQEERLARITFNSTRLLVVGALRLE